MFYFYLKVIVGGKNLNMLDDNKKYNEKIYPNSAKIEELKSKLPEYFTKDNNFDLLKLQDDLRENNINELTSGYQLDFIGKDYAKKQSGERPTTVIVPDIENNNKKVNETSKNLFFTGDNLEILRHLQANYSNEIDFIYIDPPYNTGTDGFVYPDSFEYSDKQLKDIFGLDEDGLRRLKSIQGKSTHSAWLAFMYPRLYLAKQLLKETGVIFISIDDNEQANLKILMDMIFGEGNFVGNIAWESKTKSQNTKDAYDKLQPRVEHIFVYEKLNHRRFNLEIQESIEYNETDDRGKYREKLIEEMSLIGERGRESMVFPIEGIMPGEGKQWKLGKDSIKKYKDRYDLYIKNGKPYVKMRPGDERAEKTKPFWAFFDKTIGTAESGKKEVKKYFNNQAVFDTVKPVKLIKQLIMHGTQKDDVILDFFSGSSTTADAVMQLNAEDGGSRRYIMATLPEPTYTLNQNGEKVPTKGGKPAFNAGYYTIDEISRERILLAADKIKKENKGLDSDFDFGFKHYRFVPTTFDKLEDLDFSNNIQLDLFDNLISSFSAKSLTRSHKNTNPHLDFPWHGYNLGDSASGYDTILQTWLVSDGYKFDVDVRYINFDDHHAAFVDETRVYLINENWSTENTKALINSIGNNEISIQTIVVYGYSFSFEALRELEIALQQLDKRVNLIVRY